MAKGVDVLRMIRPNGGWIIVGDDYEGITWVEEAAQCTKKEFEDGFKTVDAFMAQQESQKNAQKQAILDRLGISAEEAAIILS
jgi:hypothetical protein